MLGGPGRAYGLGEVPKHAGRRVNAGNVSTCRRQGKRMDCQLSIQKRVSLRDGLRPSNKHATPAASHTLQAWFQPSLGGCGIVGIR